MAKTFEESWTEATADRLAPNRDLGKSIAGQCWRARDADFSALQRELEDEKSCGFSMSAELESLRPREEWLEAENKRLERQLREAQAKMVEAFEFIGTRQDVDNGRLSESDCDDLVKILHTADGVRAVPMETADERVTPKG